MKIAITATGKDLNSEIDPRFGRAEYFIIIDPETMEFESIFNEGNDTMHGAGIQSGQLMAESGVNAVITGSVGPNAFQTLQAANIDLYQVNGGTVKEALDKFNANKLSPINQFGPAHAGMGKAKK